MSGPSAVLGIMEIPPSLRPEHHRFTGDMTDDELDEENRSLTLTLQEINQEILDNKARQAEWVRGGRPQRELQDEKADWARWRASAQFVHHLAKNRRDDVGEEIRSRIEEDMPRGFGLRGVVYRFVEKVLEMEEDDDVPEEELFDLLDDCRVFARGQGMTLREWFVDNKAKWGRD